MSYKHETSVDSIHEIFPTLLVVQLNTTADITYTKISLFLELGFERRIAKKIRWGYFCNRIHKMMEIFNFASYEY